MDTIYIFSSKRVSINMGDRAFPFPHSQLHVFSLSLSTISNLLHIPTLLHPPKSILSSSFSLTPSQYSISVFPSKTIINYQALSSFSGIKLMERANKQVGAASSSLAVDLFGPKDSSSNSPNSSSGYFGSIFGPQTSMVPGRESSPKDYANYGNAKQETATDYKSVRVNPVKKVGVNSSYDDNGRSASVEPCYYNSSIYYGGQEVYSPTTPNKPPQNFKKDGTNADQNESNSSGASRGNWWQGSLYY